jgi:hypothetical protein
VRGMGAAIGGREWGVREWHRYKGWHDSHLDEMN